MSRESALRLDSSQPQQASHEPQGSSRGRHFHVGDPVPFVLTKDELADFTGYSFRQIDRFRQTRSHPGIVELEGPGHVRFCGRAAKAWAEGGAVEPARRHFFGTARKR